LIRLKAIIKAKIELITFRDIFKEIKGFDEKIIFNVTYPIKMKKGKKYLKMLLFFSKLNKKIIRIKMNLNSPK
jgi:hypothetical protein